MTELHQRKTVLGIERATTIDYTKAQGRARAIGINHKGTGPIMSSSGHPSGPLELTTHRQAHGGNEEEHTEYRVRSQCRYGCRDREQRSLSPEGPGTKSFGSNVRDACFPKCFWAPNNIIKCDGKTNPSVWLEDYHLACRVGGADNDLFIIQFHPIYFADTSRAWLDHFAWRIFTKNF
jgi:hypothetical protein